jgi:hypothetical protein
MITVGHPTVIAPPWAVASPRRAAGIPPIITVRDPWAITSGGPTHVAMSPTLAAGIPPMMTVGQPGGSIGPPTCGTGGVPGVTIGHVCISPTLAAGRIGPHSIKGEYLTFYKPSILKKAEINELLYFSI